MTEGRRSAMSRPKRRASSIPADVLFNDARAVENLERSLPERGEGDDSDVTFLYYAGEPAVSVAKTSLTTQGVSGDPVAIAC